MTSVIKSEENAEILTPSFFISGWELDQFDNTFSDGFKESSGVEFDMFSKVNELQLPNEHDELDYFSGKPGASSVQNIFSHALQPNTSDNDIGEILTPGLSFLSVNVDTSMVADPSASRFLEQLPPTQSTQQCAASLIFGPEGLEALPFGFWSKPADLHDLQNSTVRGSGVEERTLILNGQVTPGDSPQDGEQAILKDSSNSMQSIPPSRQDSLRQDDRVTKSKRSLSETIGAVATDSKLPKRPENTPKKPRKSKKKPITKEQGEAKRKRFLERNRVAADKCRQNRKKWIDDLQEKCHRFSSDNALKKVALDEMGQEIMQLKRMLLVHSQNCEHEDMAAWADTKVTGPSNPN